MNQALEISIVTPVFNSVQWIEFCVRSVRYALQGRDYEHLVCDGGSQDGTLEYLQQQKDLRLISGPDRGMYDALNKGMAAARGRILGHLNADEQYDRAGLAHALSKLEQTGADAIFGPTIMLDGQLNFLYLFNQITVPRPIDVDWHMPVQSCSLLFRRQIWERCPYPAEYRVVGDHVWFRRQMKLGLKLVSVRKPIGIFTWHEDDIAKRLGSHGENALADVDRRSPHLRVARAVFRFRRFFRGSWIRPAQIAWQECAPNGSWRLRRVLFPRLRFSRRRWAKRACK